MKKPTLSHYLHGLLAPDGAGDGDGWCVAEEPNVDTRGGETGACGGDGQVACGLCGTGEGGAWRVRQDAFVHARIYGIQHSARSCHATARTYTPLPHSLPHETYIPRAHHCFYHTTSNDAIKNEEHTQQHTRTRLHHTRRPPLINTRPSVHRARRAHAPLADTRPQWRRRRPWR